MTDASGVLASSTLGRAFPACRPEDALALLDQVWGVRGRPHLTRLPTERDDTFLVEPETSPGGGQRPAGRLLVKVDSPDEPAGRSEGRAGILDHLRRAAPDLPVPRVVPSRDGRLVVVAEVGGLARRATLLTFLEGRPVHALGGVPGPRLTADIGRCLGVMSAALATCPVEPWGGDLVWDVRHAPQIVDEVLDLAPREWRGALERAGGAAAAALRRVADEPAQACHNDFHDRNLLVGEDPDRLSGILDFGDAVWSPAVCELGTALAYVVARDPGDADPLVRARELLAAYRVVHEVPGWWPDVLPGLMAGRLAIAMLIPLWRAHQDPQAFPVDRERIGERSAALARLDRLGPARTRELLQGGTGSWGTGRRPRQEDG